MTESWLLAILIFLPDGSEEMLSVASRHSSLQDCFHRGVAVQRIYMQKGQAVSFACGPEMKP